MEDYFMHETTAFIHSIPVDPLTGAISVPVYQTSTFVQEAPGVNKGYDYARSNNPTFTALENLIAGLVVTANEALGDQIRFYQNAAGAILGPFDSWLVIRGMESLSLRLKQHCKSALEVAQFLSNQPEVDRVFYPGLPEHPNHLIAKKQSRSFGGIVSFTLKDDSLEAARRFVCTTSLFKLAESLGGIKSLISHSAEMTHKTIPQEIRRASGVNDSLIRLSVGLEEAEDLITDLRNTFALTVVSSNIYSHHLENC